MVSKRGRKTSLTPELKENLIAEIKELGSFAKAAAAFGIKYDTFLKWRGKYQDFRVATDNALQFFKRKQYRTIRSKCLEQLIEILYEGVIETKVVEQETKTPDGTISTRTVTKTHKGPPMRLLERYLGEPMDILDAVQLLGSHQLLSEEAVARIYDTLTQAEESSREIIQNNTPSAGGVDISPASLEEE